MELPSLLRAAHILGVVLWIGGLVGVLALVARTEATERAALAKPAHAALRLVVTPGLLLAWIAGLGILVPAFGEVYAKAGWMHGKLLLALIATALTGIAGARVRKMTDSGGGFGGMALGALATAAIIVLLVMTRPF